VELQVRLGGNEKEGTKENGTWCACEGEGEGGGLLGVMEGGREGGRCGDTRASSQETWTLSPGHEQVASVSVIVRKETCVDSTHPTDRPLPSTRPFASGRSATYNAASLDAFDRFPRLVAKNASPHGLVRWVWTCGALPVNPRRGGGGPGFW
jgi:hypothetical protein